MSTCWQEELNVFEGSACGCCRPMWKLASCIMVAKVLRIASWVHVHSLPWTQRKRWIPIGSKGCVYTHQGIPGIERWGYPSCIWNVVEKTWEANWKLGKIGWIVNKTFTLGPKHDKIWAQWVSYIPLESMLEKVWWCKCSKMESWNRTIYYSMNFLNERRHVWIGGDRKSHVALKSCWKRKVLLSTCAKASRRKGHWSTINLIIMIEVIRAQLLK